MIKIRHHLLLINQKIISNKYINDKLIKDINAKSKTDHIVSHNATIPVLADAENIIYCWADGDKISIRSNYMKTK